MTAEEVVSAIDACGFSEHDIDMATSGLCAAFALALKAAFPELSLGFIVVNDDAGRPGVAKDGDPLWRHAVCMSGGVLFDIFGRIELEHAVENFCWKSTNGGSLIEVDEAEMTRVATSDNRSFDASYFETWRSALVDAAAVSPVPAI